jgi:hypothetical protein
MRAIGGSGIGILNHFTDNTGIDRLIAGGLYIADGDSHDKNI